MNKQGYLKEDKGDNFPCAPGFRGPSSDHYKQVMRLPRSHTCIVVSCYSFSLHIAICLNAARWACRAD